MRSPVSLVPCRARLRWSGVVVAAVLAAGTAAVPPSVAGAQQCPEANPTYTDTCGPTFVVPAWGDGGGWKDPSKYSTIQLADFNGDGKDELLARNDQGLEIYWFDTTLGQWRPQVDAEDLPQALTDFRSPLPNETPATDWTKPEFYSTIQIAHINGNKEAQILARFADGMRVYYFNAGPGGSINGGSWSLISRGGPFSDADGWNDPSRYQTIRTGNINFSDLGTTHLIGRSHSGLVIYKWNGSGWSPLSATQPGPPGPETVFADSNCEMPSCYGLFRVPRFTWPQPVGSLQLAVGRTDQGVDALYNTSFGWFPVNVGSGDFGGGPSDDQFSDLTGGPDCPFSGTNDCLGSSPSYYETFGVADIDGDGSDEIFARGADGLRVKKLNVNTTTTRSTWTTLPTLTDLAGDAASVQPGAWGSIRTADIDGDKKQEVLAVTGSGLQVWSYNPASTSWQRWQPSTPLALTGDWLTKPEYFATIRTGDVDGDGHDDVIARGQFGIRTWFYNRRGTGGWERYLPGGYQAFQGGNSGSSGYQNAFDAFNKVATFENVLTKSQSSVRDVWMQANASSAQDLKNLQQELTDLQNGMLRFAGCVEPPNPGTPLSYQSCARPSNDVLSRAGVPTDGAGVPLNNFDAADWTWVVNETLAEIAMAQAVVEHFGDLETMREGVFESASNALPAIAADLQLAGAAGNTTNFNLNGTFAAAYGIAASLAALIPGGEAASAALWVASEAFSALPSASPTANSAFSTTYDGLLDKVATAQDEMATALNSQLQQVFGDQSLLDLVGQLRSRGTWNPDTDGAQSASRQAFVLTTYQALMPTVFTRYAITNCTTQQWSTGTLDCELPKGPLVIGDSSGKDGTWVGPATNQPCKPTGYYDTNCDYSQDPGLVPDSVASIVWGAVPATCNYQPGTKNSKNTLWTFGCPLGVPIATSIGADSPGWTFNTRTAHPVLAYFSSVGGAVPATPGPARASAAQADSSARGSREVLGPLRFTGRTFTAPALRLGRARVVVERTLFEHGRGEELARTRSGRRLKPFALKRVAPGEFTSRKRGEPGVRLRLRRLDARGRARLDLRLSRVRIRDIRALCTVLPARVSQAGRPLELETRLRLRDRAATHRITVRQRWRCVRDRKGEFTGIRPIKPKSPAARPGLAVRMKAARMLTSGRRATVRITITNRRRARPSRVVSSLWDLRITASAGGPPRTVRVKELRARRSRTVRVTVPVRRSARGRVCLRVAANATSARGASDRRCARTPTAPLFTG
jgi:hypothetical protein